MPERDRNGTAAETGAVSFAVVGLGYWGPNLVRVLNELGNTEVIAVFDVRTDSCSEIVKRYPSVRAARSYDELLQDDAIEAVAIATPVSTHFDLAAAALRAGKHVFVEKPLAGSTEEAVELIELARTEDRTLMPGHTFLYSPPVNLSRDLIRSGDLGEIFFISTSRVNLGLHQPDVSVIWDLGPHDFSILRYWLDEMPTRVSAWSRGCIIDSVPDVAFVNLEFPSGTIAHVELSWLAPSKLRRTAIVGSRKMVVYDDTSVEPIRIFDSGADVPDPETFGEFRMTYRAGDIVSPHVAVTEPLSIELNDFVRAVTTGSAPTSSTEIGLDVIRIVEAVDQSLADGGRPVDVARAVSHLAAPGV
jgi:predicted dehydrogenase